jgi:hypothetical protein
MSFFLTFFLTDPPPCPSPDFVLKRNTSKRSAKKILPQFGNPVGSSSCRADSSTSSKRVIPPMGPASAAGGGRRAHHVAFQQNSNDLLAARGPNCKRCIFAAATKFVVSLRLRRTTIRASCSRLYENDHPSVRPSVRLLAAKETICHDLERNPGFEAAF